MTRSGDDTRPDRRVRVALDLLGGDHAPGVVVDGALRAVSDRPDLDVVLVGPPHVAAALLDGRDAAGRIDVAAASEVVEMHEDPGRAVRAKRDATVRVAARLVRDGLADAMVSVGSTGAAMAAAMFTLGRLAGVTRPALAVTVPARRGPVILLDVGANVDCTPDLLAQFALAGAAYAKVRTGVAMPLVGLLSIGAEERKGDALRKEAFDLLAGLPIRFAGNVESGTVVDGGVDVVVTDGFTGNVLLKGLEAMWALVRTTLAAAGAGGPGSGPAEAMAALDGLSPDRLGGAMLLGTPGVVVVGHGASGPHAVASCVTLAAEAARDGLVPRVAAAMSDLVARRRQAAGSGSTTW